MRQISVVYTCCRAQEYWPLTEHGELEMEHSELGTTCAMDTGTYQDRMDALRRERDEAAARAARAERLVGAMERIINTNLITSGYAIASIREYQEAWNDYTFLPKGEGEGKS